MLTSIAEFVEMDFSVYITKIFQILLGAVLKKKIVRVTLFKEKHALHYYAIYQKIAAFSVRHLTR